MNTELIAWGLTLALGVLSAIFGNTIKNLTKECFDVFKAIEAALLDDKITPEEMRNVMTEAKEALLAIKGVFKRNKA